MKRSRDEMQSFLDQMSIPECGPVTCKMEDMEVPQKKSRFENEIQSFIPPKLEYGLTRFEKLEENVISIRTNLEKRRAKITLSQLNEKVDLILTILQSWNV